MKSGFKMKGYSYPGKSPVKQKVSEDKSQTRKRYQGPLDEETTKRLEEGESNSYRFNEKDEAAYQLEEQARQEAMSQDMGDDKDGKAKAKKTQKKANNLYNEAYIVRDRTKKKQ